MTQGSLFDGTEGVTRRHCAECGEGFEPYVRAEGYQMYCSHRCRQRAHRAKEEALKDRGMRVAADSRPEDLEEARRLAGILWDVGRRPVSIDDVREAAEAEGRNLDFSRNWVGSVFRGWLFCGTCKARHEGSHGRRISLWRKP